MKVAVEMETAKGFYADANVECRGNVKDCLEKVLSTLDAMTAEVDGVKGWEWTEIRIRIIA